MYISPSTNEECTAAQLLAELACLKEGKKHNVNLVGKFWNQPVWKKKFKAHILSANQILKVYPEEAVIAAFRKHWSYSLRYHDFIDAVKIECAKLEQKAAAVQEHVVIQPSNSNAVRSNTYGDKSRLSKL